MSLAQSIDSASESTICIWEKAVETYLATSKTYKIAMVANHTFRAMTVAGFLTALPVSPFVSAPLTLAGSLFYRLSAERFCHYKLALPSWAGGVALLIAKNASNLSFFSSIASLIPLVLWGTYVHQKVNNDPFSSFRRNDFLPSDYSDDDVDSY